MSYFSFTFLGWVYTPDEMNAQEQKSAVGTRIWKKIFFAQIFRKEKNLEREMLYFRLIFKKGR